jgi:hypothetical protein
MEGSFYKTTLPGINITVPLLTPPFTEEGNLNFSLF